MEIINNLTTNYILDSTSNSVLDATTNVYSYDNNGNMIQMDNRYYRYDSVNRLTKVESATSVTATYTYNPWSQRVSKELGYIMNKPVYIYVYNKAGELLTEVDGTRNNQIRNYIWLDGAPLAILEDSNVYFYHNDHNGTPVVVTNSAQQAVWTPMDFFAFGQTYVGNTAITQNLRLPGQYYDAETKLHYNWHRYYSPLLGRYGTSDPLGLAAGMNTYSYVNNNPINYTDPTGLETYQCTKSLHKIGDNFVGYLAYKLTPAYHQYSCTVRDEQTICGGQDIGDGKPLIKASGKPSADTMNPSVGKCVLSQPNNTCFETCMQNEWRKPRPNYNLINFGGVNCQKYDDDLNNLCKNQCNL